MTLRTALVASLFTCFIGCAAPTQLDVPPHAVIGVREEQLDANYWIARSAQPAKVVLARSSIDAQNARLRSTDPTFRDLEKFGTTLNAAQVRAWITALSTPPSGTLYDEQGAPIEATRIDAIVKNAAPDSIPETQPTRYGMVVKRANVRTLPTSLRVFRSADDADIDRFQESALFPGTPVVIAHTSADAQWYFVVSALYAAWVERELVAEGTAQDVFGYTRKEPYLVVTGSTIRTVFTRERPEVSELQLDMGVRVPLLEQWPADRAVNGQHAYTGHIIELPWRDANGALRFTPAMIPKTADVSSDYLQLTERNLLDQGFKFLGERYGWGHSYNARDCSGFVSEIYRSFGVTMPRNTRDQGMSPAFRRITLDKDASYENRLAIIRTLRTGDLIYIPGHVMMVIGRERGTPYVIHDTAGISYRDADGEVHRVKLNGVAVTPLVPLLLSDDRPLIERIYSIVLMRTS